MFGHVEMHDSAAVVSQDIPEIARGLRQNGGGQGYLLAAKLCR